MLGLSIRTSVEHTDPDHPITLELKDKTSKTFRNFILDHCEEFNPNYKIWLNPFLINSHLQTVYSQYAHSFIAQIPIWYNRHLIDYPDGGQGALDYVDLPITQKNLTGELSNEEIKTLMEDSKNRKGQFRKIDNEGKDEFLELELPSNTYHEKNDHEYNEIINRNSPLIILLHGLSGGSQETYVKNMIKQLVLTTKSKFDIFVLNSRGCSNTVIKTPQLYNGIWTDDIRYLINEEILSKNPNKEIYMAGFSLGGVVLTNYLSQESRLNESMVKKNIKLGIAVSVPWDMTSSSAFLNENGYIGKEIYSPAMAKGLNDLIKRNYHELKNNKILDQKLLKQIFLDQPNSVKYLKDFDYNFTSRMFGFNNHEEYYSFASPIQRLHRIKTPFLMLSSLDDPVVGPKVPYYQVKSNPYLQLMTTHIGGHVCWFTKNGEQWYNNPMAKLIMSFHEKVESVKIEKESLPKDATIECDRIVLPGGYTEFLLNKNKQNGQ